MKKIVMLVSILVLALNPFGQLFTHAASGQYDNIKHGEYPITAKALHADSDQPSGAASFLKEDVKLTVNENGIELTFTIPHNPMAFIGGMQIEGVEGVQNGEQWTYKLSTLKQLYNARVQYEVPAMNMNHDVPLRFSLEGLENLPVAEPEVEQPEPEEPEVEQPEPEQPEVEEPKPETPGLTNGFYTVNSAYLHASEDKPSSMARYLSDAIFLNVQDEKVELTIAVNDHKTVTKMTVDGKNPISTKLDGNTRYETFSIDSLDQMVTAKVDYQAPFGNSIHYGNAAFRIDMDLANAKMVDASEQPGYGINAEYLNLEDGLYSISATYLNAKNGQASAMARYLGDRAYISVEEGNAEIYILIKDNGTVTKLTVNDQQVIEQIVNGKNTLESFNMNPTITELVGYAEYEAPFGGGTHYGNAEFNISLNKATLQKEQQLPIENEEPKEEQPKPETPEPEKPEEPTTKPENPTLPVEGFTIDYVVKHATEDEASAADNFFVKPGVLLKQDGKNYLQITIKNWSMIEWLKVNGKSVTVIEEDKAADTALVQFQIPNDLNEVIQLSMKVVVPGLYETVHDARLVLDESSLIEIETDEDHIIHVPSTDEGDTPPTHVDGDPSTPGKKDETIQKPDFGTNDTNVDQSKNDVKSNPQTGDNSKLILYSVLLFSSLVLLAIQYRKHRMHA